MIQFKRGTSSQWTSNNPTLSAGQPGVEFDNTQDITKIKIGDGSSTYSNLPYISANPVINQKSGTGFNDMEISGFYDMLSVPTTNRPSDSTSYKSFIFGNLTTGYVSQFAIDTSSTNGPLFYRTNNTSLSSTSAWQTILKTSQTDIDTIYVPLVRGSTGNVTMSSVTSARLNSFPEAETGTWSPTISGADITAISSTYVKIGNYVYLAGGIRFTEQLPNTASDTFIIEGLPFAPNQAAPSSFTMSTLMNGTGTFVGSLSSVINIAAVFTGTSFYVVRQNTTGGYLPLNFAQVSTFFGTGYLYFQVHYRT